LWCRGFNFNDFKDDKEARIYKEEGHHTYVFVMYVYSTVTQHCQVTRPAVERDENDRIAYKMLVGEHFLPEHLVFADECHFNRLSFRRDFAWAPRGNRARRRDFFIRGKRYFCCGISYHALIFYLRYSILPALSLDGILHLEVLDHSFTGEEFRDFVTGVLDQMQPWPMPNSVLVMDNASIHKVPGIRDMVEQRYVSYLFPT